MHMNKVLVAIILFLAGAGVKAQSTIEVALATGDAAAVAAHFEEQVELCIFNREDVFRKGEAMKMLEEFFAEHKVTGFRKVHAGASKGKESNYSIGELKTESDTYRVFLYFDTTADKRIVRELRIETMR